MNTAAIYAPIRGAIFGFFSTLRQTADYEDVA